jgi:hypothetical protein
MRGKQLVERNAEKHARRQTTAVFARPPWYSGGR